MSNRKPYWELHIRPMFRAFDNEHMVRLNDPERRIDLFDYKAVRDNAVKILGALEDRFMPPKDEGGPWPYEWIILFDRWINAGGPQLDRADATYKATRSGNTVSVAYTVKVARSTDFAWLERVGTSDSPREYVFYVEPVEGGSPDEQTGELRFAATAGVDYLVINDVRGATRVPIT